MVAALHAMDEAQQEQQIGYSDEGMQDNSQFPQNNAGEGLIFEPVLKKRTMSPQKPLQKVKAQDGQFNVVVNAGSDMFNSPVRAGTFKARP
jgi:hypothetical protein